jgi:hypothetical protein
MRRLRINCGLCAVVLWAANSAHAGPGSLLPLQPGPYVVSSYKPCEEAPLAAVVQFDGRAIFGPHESNCTISIESHKGRSYRLSTECQANGDGSAASPTKALRTVRIESKVKFSVVSLGSPVAYELCVGFH